MDPILVAQQLGKKFYRVPNKHVTYGLSDLFGAILRRPPNSGTRRDEFWAIRGVSMALQPGGSLGVIGRNGSGKTTLMKMLAGIIRPDEGTYALNGNVQALIALGAGFSPGLTGRQNAMNGLALRGPLPHEMKQRVEQIIEFSDLGDFIDSPVNTYSTGMRARLGFAICVHLDPTLIIIDEALSVGDMEFQNKCLMRLQQMRKQGVAMVLVSHSMTHIQQFCETAIWVEKGVVQEQGKVKDVVNQYVRYIEQNKSRASSLARPSGKDAEPAAAPAAGEAAAGSQAAAKASKESAKADKASDGKGAAPSRPGAAGKGSTATDAAAGNGKPTGPVKKVLRDAAGRSKEARTVGVSEAEVAELFGGFIQTPMVEDVRARLMVGDEEVDHLVMNQACLLEYSFQLTERVSDLNVSLSFFRRDGLHMTTISTLNGDLLKPYHEGHIRCRVEIPDLTFSPGEYVIVMPIHLGRSYLHRDAVKSFQVRSGERMSWGLVNLTNRYTVLD